MAWRDPKVVEAALAEACDAIAAVAGATFDADHGGRPAVRIATVEDATAALSGELGPVLERIGPSARAGVRATATDAGQPIANGLYGGLGMVPRLPLFNLVGRPERPDALVPLPAGIRAELTARGVPPAEIKGRHVW